MASLPINPRNRRRDLLLGTCAAMLGPTRLWAEEPAASKIPSAEDLSPLMSAAKDQGDRYTCAAFAAIAVLEAAIRRDLGQCVVLSEEFAIYLARRGPWNGPDESMPMDPFFDGAINIGSVLEPDWPYRLELPPGCMSSASVTPRTRTGMKTSTAPRPCRAPVPPQALLVKAAQLKAVHVVVPPSRPNTQYPIPNTQWLMAWLGWRQRAITMAVKDLPGRDEWRDSGELRLTARVQALSRRGALDKFPNHYVTLSGYDRDERKFFFKNSWGRAWGREGFGWISFEDMNSALVMDSGFMTASYLPKEKTFGPS